MISQHRLQDAERIARLTMIIILLTAGTSKFFSNHGFYDYYSTLFQGDLRIKLPASLVNLYLLAVPFVEIGLGLALLSNQFRTTVIYAWFAFMLSLLFGHYILQEWSAVNQMLSYIFLGLTTLILPAHQSWLTKPDLS
ncbi:MAG: putative membrane protein YphA (DoxX/SURF4 family) [Arenicella sp.]|jgi:uncharacterized membrane protein YphA (DoxX/SURF4 family)